MTVWIGKRGRNTSWLFIYWVGSCSVVIDMWCWVVWSVVCVFTVFDDQEMILARYFDCRSILQKTLTEAIEPGQQLQNTSKNWDKGTIINCSFISIIVRHACNNCHCDSLCKRVCLGWRYVSLKCVSIRLLTVDTLSFSLSSFFLNSFIGFHLIHNLTSKLCKRAIKGGSRRKEKRYYTQSGKN